MQKLIICLIVISSMACHPFFNNVQGHMFHERPMEQLHRAMHAFKHFSEPSGFLNKILASPSQNVVIIKERIVSSNSSGSLSHNKYDACLDLVEIVNKNIVEMARTCLDGNWRDTIPVFVDTAEKLANAVKCFIDAGKTSVASSLNIDPQCVINHLNLAAEALQDALKAVLQGNWNKAQEYVQTFIDTLSDIKNC